MNEKWSMRWLMAGMVQAGFKQQALPGSLRVKTIMVLTVVAMALIFLLPFFISPN